MEIEQSEHGFMVRLESEGSLAFFLRTLLRAKFYDDEGIEGLLSPLLNNAIAETLHKLESTRPGTAAYYAGWVEEWHLARASALVASSPDYLGASPAEQKAMMRGALYPHEPKE